MGGCPRERKCAVVKGKNGPKRNKQQEKNQGMNRKPSQPKWAVAESTKMGGGRVKNGTKKVAK
jgi:hypothetical protein